MGGGILLSESLCDLLSAQSVRHLFWSIPLVMLHVWLMGSAASVPREIRCHEAESDLF